MKKKCYHLKKRIKNQELKTKTFLKKKHNQQLQIDIKWTTKIQDTDGFHKTCPSPGILLVLTKL